MVVRRMANFCAPQILQNTTKLDDTTMVDDFGVVDAAYDIEDFDIPNDAGSDQQSTRTRYEEGKRKSARPFWRKLSRDKKEDAAVHPLRG